MDEREELRRLLPPNWSLTDEGAITKGGHRLGRAFADASGTVVALDDGDAERGLREHLAALGLAVGVSTGGAGCAVTMDHGRVVFALKSAHAHHSDARDFPAPPEPLELQSAPRSVRKSAIACRLDVPAVARARRGGPPRDAAREVTLALRDWAPSLRRAASTCVPLPRAIAASAAWMAAARAIANEGRLAIPDANSPEGQLLLAIHFTHLVGLGRASSSASGGIAASRAGAREALAKLAAAPVTPKVDAGDLEELKATGRVVEATLDLVEAAGDPDRIGVVAEQLARASSDPTYRAAIEERDRTLLAQLARTWTVAHHLEDLRLTEALPNAHRQAYAAAWLVQRQELGGKDGEDARLQAHLDALSGR